MEYTGEEIALLNLDRFLKAEHPEIDHHKSSEKHLLINAKNRYIVQTYEGHFNAAVINRSLLDTEEMVGYVVPTWHLDDGDLMNNVYRVAFDRWPPRPHPGKSKPERKELPRWILVVALIIVVLAIGLISEL